MLRSASAVVIRCFRKVEHVADYVTGAAGPVFVALAWLLTGVGGLAFCEETGSLDHHHLWII